MSKTLKTWEVIKALTENPRLKFKANNSEGVYKEIGVAGGVVCWGGERAYPLNIVIGIQGEWEEIKPEPIAVDFLGAVAAYNEGKTIRCEYGRFSLTFTSDSVDFDGRQLIDICGYGLGVKAVLNGKWFVED